jgi:carboxypeptidase Q
MDRPPRRRHRYRLRSRPANAGLPQRLSRTIRVVLFGVEEMDFSGAAYARAHEAETGKIMVAAEADFGARNVYSVQLPPGGAGSDFGRTLQRIIAPLGANVEGRSALGGGEDIRDLQKAGLPVVSLRQDGLDYFDTHHNADDEIWSTGRLRSIPSRLRQCRSGQRGKMGR